MSRPLRSLLRAAPLILALSVLSGCAEVPTGQAAAAHTSTATIVTGPSSGATDAPSATGVAVAAATPTENASATPERDPVLTTSPAAATPGALTATRLPAVPPSFGPGWGDRTIYSAGLVAGERKILDQLTGASEYRIDLRIDDSLTSISGQEQVWYTNREDRPLNELYVRLFPNALGGKMRVSDVSVDGVAATPDYQSEETAVRTPLPQPLPVGASTVLSLKYQIEVPTSLDKGYGLLSYTSGILALDTPYAPIPVFNDRGWNAEIPPPNADTSFNDVSFYLVRITAPANLKLVVTGVEVDRKSEGAEQVATFEQGPARDFFIAASSDYVVTTSQVGETRVNSYALPGEEAGANTALQAAVTGLGIYGRLFGPYPYTELDIAATPMLALGIEYPGTVGVSERIYDPNYKPATASARVMLESTLAHELAHQWFYNLVGNDQVNQPWLDEAMAQYSTYLYFLGADGRAAADAWRATWGSRWDRTDRAEKPVDLPAGDYSEREYSAIVYGRGPMFLAAVADRMGQAKFDQLLKDYSARFRWGIATTNDFKTMASQECGCDLTDLYTQWLDPQ